MKPFFSKINLQKLLERHESFCYHINEKKVHLQRLKLPITLKNPLEWLDTQTIYPKVFWKKKNKKETILALGSLLSYPTIPSFSHLKQKIVGPRFFGTIPFLDSLLSKTKYSVWNEVNFSGFFLPRFEIRLNSQGKGQLFLNYLSDESPDDLRALLSSLLLPLSDENPLSFMLLRRIDLPNYSLWCDLIEKALHSFETTKLEKVVLARASYLTYQDALNPLKILKSLSANSTNSTLFAYLPNKEAAFIGASPENFYTRRGNKISTEAIAGTSMRGRTPEEDTQLLNLLTKSDKDLREFEYVTDFIKKKFSSICHQRKEKQSITVTQTPILQHLFRSFSGILKVKMNDKQLINTLHPTPAMGGHPTDLSMEFLDQSEPFVRGHYASPLGWISPYDSDLVVAIRSAFIKKNCMTLFAGAGIVKGSKPLKEWEELELKISQFLRVSSS